MLTLYGTVNILIMISSLSLQLSKAYKEHICFKELEEMMTFYECLSERALYFFQSKGIINYESYVVSTQLLLWI